MTAPVDGLYYINFLGVTRIKDSDGRLLINIIKNPPAIDSYGNYECIIASNNIYALRIGNGITGSFAGTKDNMFLKIAFERIVEYEFAIRLKDFDPSNIEETRKKILCVKNGKIIRYKD